MSGTTDVFTCAGCEYDGFVGTFKEFKEKYKFNCPCKACSRYYLDLYEPRQEADE